MKLFCVVIVFNFTLITPILLKAALKCCSPEANMIGKTIRKGGETASTGIYKHGLHVEVSINLVNQVELNIVADDYAYAVAA